MYDLTIIEQNGGVYIDSREVAEIIGKRHDNLLRDIAGYIRILENSVALNFEVNDFFLAATYVDSIGRTLPCYLLSKKACELVANKLIGEKGVLFTAAYVTKFNAMEKAEITRLETERAKWQGEAELLMQMPRPRLGEYNACARIIVPGLRNLGATAEQIVKVLKDIYEPLGIKVMDDGELESAPKLYTAKQIAKKLGIYSINGNPHHQAVACILNENLYIGDDHKTVETRDYGNHIGVYVRYNDYALLSVKDWIKEYGYPREIYGFDRTYQVLYKD